MLQPSAKGALASFVGAVQSLGCAYHVVLSVGCHSSVQVTQEVVGFFLFVDCHCGSVEKSMVYISLFLPPVFHESSALQGWNQVMGCQHIFYEEVCVCQDVCYSIRCIL